MKLTQCVALFARNLKPRIPLQQEVLQYKAAQLDKEIAESSYKYIARTHTINQLIELHQDIGSNVNLAAPILRRMGKLELNQEDITNNQDFITKLIKTGNAYEEALLLFTKFTNEQVERQLLLAFQQGQYQFSNQNSIRLLEIINKYGTQADIEKWEMIPMFSLNGASITRFYQCIDTLQFKLSTKLEILKSIENQLHKYTHMLSYETIEIALRHRTYNSLIINEQLVYAFVQRLLQFELTFDQIIQVNQYLVVDLKYVNSQWINLISSNVYALLDAQPEQQENIDDDQLFSDLELKEKILGKLEQQLIQLMAQLSELYITSEFHQLIIQMFTLIESHLLAYFNQLTPDEQLISYKFHSRLIETVYQEALKDQKTYKKTTSKRLELMNNTYFETTISHVKQLNFEQTLQLLDYTSVLGISKRKVCRSIMKKGLAGLEQVTKSNLTNDQKNYALMSYYRFLQMFITKPEDIQQIEAAYIQIKINTLDLQSEYGHLAQNRKNMETYQIA